MATKRMLVDATHPEETRIVVTSGNRLEEFDFESASRRQLRGNIYLAKVTRVEPSLQAAFVEYGGNRHGFLAFSEIHPDYYQIPVADREALLAEAEEEEAAQRAAEAAEDAIAETAAKSARSAGNDEADEDEDGHVPNRSDDGDEDDDEGENGNSRTPVEALEPATGDEDALEEIPHRKKSLARRYKIQEVIKRRQVILVQVVKEERGNKGAALTTYLSLAGRYSVLMPNTARGGGISRKITNAPDRKRLKEIASELKVPQGMGIILRTAGASRTKAEVKRDFEYLLRLWENVRNLTLQSQAPSLVYEEGSLIKRTIRDLYNKDIDEVLVAGEEAYREAKDFMRMIMPSHAKNVKLYNEDQHIFAKFNAESQLDAMFSPRVTLPSGGYIVINPTEALVSIDVNSGRSTKEHNIEDTAYQTNLEAADEVARQLRLRDLAGLIVIDFIDMNEKRSIRNVERRLKDALRNDRARIQVGRISHFGLLEMSRQRMRFGVLESSTHVCPTCAGAGIVRSVESVALMVMRAIEDHVLKRAGASINVRVPMDVALYLLNAKRNILSELEVKQGLTITITADATLIGHNFSIEKGEARIRPDAARAAISVDSAQVETADTDDDVEDEAEAEAETDTEADTDTEAATGEDRSERPRRRRRRGGRNRNRRDQDARPDGQASDTETSERNDDEEAAESADSAPNADDEQSDKPRRRRGRRGGRRNRRSDEAGTEGGSEDTDAITAVEGVQVKAEAEAKAEAVGDLDSDPEVPAEVEAEQQDKAEAQTTSDAAPAEEAEEKPAKKPRRSRRKKADTDTDAGPGSEAAAEAAPKARRSAKAQQPEEAQPEAAQPAPEPQSAEPEPTASSQDEANTTDSDAEDAVSGSSRPRRARRDLPDDGIIVTSSSGEDEEAEKPKRGGWWQRALGKS